MGLKIKRFAEREEKPKPKQSKASANERKKVVASRKEKFSAAAGVLEKEKCVQLFNDRLSCKKAKKYFQTHDVSEKRVENLASQPHRSGFSGGITPPPSFIAKRDYLVPQNLELYYIGSG